MPMAFKWQFSNANNAKWRTSGLEGPLTSAYNGFKNAPYPFSISGDFEVVPQYYLLKYIDRHTYD